MIQACSRKVTSLLHLVNSITLNSRLTKDIKKKTNPKTKEKDSNIDAALADIEAKSSFSEIHSELSTTTNQISSEDVDNEKAIGQQLNETTQSEVPVRALTEVSTLPKEKKANNTPELPESSLNAKADTPEAIRGKSPIAATTKKRGKKSVDLDHIEPLPTPTQPDKAVPWSVRKVLLWGDFFRGYVHRAK